ncbi:MAG: flagellar hook-associated protein FlgK [Thermodesulfovibrionales bacterium]|nr:flagellar hook-associated protein FlgK [Thermodesulfovibrionales bacterium]
MALFSLFDIGKTALLVNKRAMDTVAHNVANANTPGYSRQEPVYETVPAGYIVSAVSSGRGVALAEIRRLYDAFTTSQIRMEKSNAAYWDAYESNMFKIEDIFNETQDASVGQGINDFFDQWQQVVKSPEAYADRAMLINKAEYMAERIANAFRDLDNQRASLVSSTKTLISEINKIAEEISGLNEKIGMAPGAHDLRDKRDYLVERLSEIMKVNVFEDNNGRYTILLGGYPLVDGGKYYELSYDVDGAGKLHIYSNMQSPPREITDDIQGGEIKANIDLRDKVILGVMNKLNALAINLADAVNFYHRQGYGLDGSTGKDFFYQNNSLVTWTNPTNGTVVRYNVQDLTQFSNTINREYTSIVFNGGNSWTANWTDNSTVPPTSGSIAITDTVDTASRRILEFDGKRVVIQDNGLVAGANFTIGQNKNAAINLSVAISDPNHLAVAGGDTVPVGTMNNQIRYSLNGGSTYIIGQLPVGEYTRDQLASALQTMLGAGVTVSFNQATRLYTIQNTTGSTIVFDWTSSNSTAAGLFGFHTNSYIPNGGSDISDYNVYPIPPQTPRSGDNLTARLINGLKEQNIIVGSKPMAFYQGIVDYVGVEAEASKINSEFYKITVEQLEKKRQETSGVSLDEEAINLVKYQKSFQAAAKLITVADELFATLVNMTGR